MMITTAGVRATGLYLLELLHQTSPLLYSKFYGDQGEEDVLAKGALPFVRADETEDVPEEDLLEEGHVMLESAAWQLEDLGLVRIVLSTKPGISGSSSPRKGRECPRQT